MEGGLIAQIDQAQMMALIALIGMFCALFWAGVLTYRLGRIESKLGIQDDNTPVVDLSFKRSVNPPRANAEVKAPPPHIE